MGFTRSTSIVDVCCKEEKVEICVTFLNMEVNSTITLQSTHPKVYIKIH